MKALGLIGQSCASSSYFVIVPYDSDFFRPESATIICTFIHLVDPCWTLVACSCRGALLVKVAIY